jgi:hypothetical protein
MATFGDRYKKLIDSNPNKKSIPNNNPGIVQGSNISKNPYENLIVSGSNKKSLFNTNPGIEFGVLKTKNPYVKLIGRWDFTKTAPYAPLIGRDIVAPIVDVYYVLNDYVDTDYVEVQQGSAW